MKKSKSFSRIWSWFVPFVPTHGMLYVTCVTWLTHPCDMTHSPVWHDSLTRVTWLTHPCDMTYSEWVDLIITYFHLWHDSCRTWDMTHSSWVICQGTSMTMGWLHVAGSLKLQVSFAKEPYERDDILQKRPIIFRSLLISATPYMRHLPSIMSHM